MTLASPADLIASGRKARFEHRLADAKEYFSLALSQSARTGDKLHTAQAHAGLGQVERDLKNNGAALKHYQFAVELFRKQENPLILAHTIRHVADILRSEKAFEQALTRYEEALEIYRAHNETPPLDLANTLRGYALAKTETGEVQEAAALWLEAQSLYEQAGVQAGVAESQSQLAFLMGR